MIRSILWAVFAVSVAAAPLAAQTAPAAEPPGVVTPPAVDLLPPQSSDSRQDQTITETVPLRYAKADQLAAELKKVVGKRARLAADARTNVLVITARAGSVERIADLAKSIDRMSGRDEAAANPYSAPIVRTFPLRHVDASDAAGVLRSVFDGIAPGAGKGEPDQAGPGAPQPGRPAPGDVGVAVDERTNAVIVTAPKENVERAGQVLRSVDEQAAPAGDTPVAQEAGSSPPQAAISDLPQQSPNPAFGQSNLPLGQASGGFAVNATPADRLAAAESYLQQTHIRLEHAAERYKLAQEQYKAGSLPQAEMLKSEEEVRLLQAQLDDAEKAFSREQRIALLTRPVSVQLRDATLGQTAEALSQASKLPIQVDKSAMVAINDKRITVTAESVPLASVLEAVAGQLQIEIAPSGKDGVVLKSWPMLEVNGQKQVLSNWPNQPWGPEWGPAVGTGFAFGGGGLGGTGGGPGGGIWTALFQQSPQDDRLHDLTLTARLGQYPSGQAGVTSAGQPPAPGEEGPAGYYGFASPNGGRPAPVALTTVGSHVVVAVAASGANGEPGVWLTLYRLQGDQLVYESTVFHALRSARRASKMNGQVAPGTSGKGAPNVPTPGLAPQGAGAAPGGPGPTAEPPHEREPLR